MSEKFEFFAPHAPSGSDLGADMSEQKSQGQGPELLAQSACASPQMARLLLRYDDIDPIARAGLRRHANSCAECGPRWELFQAADTWLEGAGGQHQVLCPETEELYDFGRGPGFAYLSAERRGEIELHVSHCEECAGFVRTLDSPVPIPWSTGSSSLTVTREVEDEEPSPPPAQPRLVKPRTLFTVLPTIERLPNWVPVAVAAGLIVTVFFATRDRLGQTTNLGDSTHGENQTHSFYPALITLRGEDHSPLVFPRGNLLSGESTINLPRSTNFELESIADAELYRVRLHKHNGGAFDLGTEVFTIESPTSTVAANLGSLKVGHYTWTAWALVRGLERPLGDRDFSISRDSDLELAWDNMEMVPAAERDARRVRLLHEHGFFGAARALAESLSPSDERNAYLAAWPGR